jgi:PKD repeat protein
VTADGSGSTDIDYTPIASYVFDFGDGTAVLTQTTATATHAYTRTGTFTMTLTVRDTANKSDKVTQRVTVKN